MAQFTEIDSIIKTDILPGLADGIFKNGPVLQFLKRNRFFKWPNGPAIQEDFLYRPMIGGAYAKGGTFNLNKRQVWSGTQFTPRQYYVNVTEYLEDVEVLAGRERAAFSLVQGHLSDAALTMSAFLAIDLWRHGQNIPGDDRTIFMNGLQEALTDETNATYTGAVFPSYGGETRSAVNFALNSPTGSQVTSPNIAGSLSYHNLEQSYDSCWIGEEHPIVGVTSTVGMGFLCESFAPYQRVVDTIEPTIGYAGLKFKQATIIKDEYAPTQNFQQWEIDELGATKPTSGEIFAWLNFGPEGEDAFLKLWFPESPLYQFGFTGFKVQADSTKVAGQLLAMLTLTSRGNRFMRIMYGITR